MPFVDTLVAVIPMLGILIVVHELGHFLVAKACGVRVLKFSIGFGAPIGFGRCAPAGSGNGTEYVIGWIPARRLRAHARRDDARGRCRGDGCAAGRAPRDSLDAKSVWQKLAVVFAGPAMNLLLPIVCLVGILWVGFPRPAAVIGTVEAEFPRRWRQASRSAIGSCDSTATRSRGGTRSSCRCASGPRRALRRSRSSATAERRTLEVAARDAEGPRPLRRRRRHGLDRNQQSAPGGAARRAGCQEPGRRRGSSFRRSRRACRRGGDRGLGRSAHGPREGRRGGARERALAGRVGYRTSAGGESARRDRRDRRHHHHHHREPAGPGAGAAARARETEGRPPARIRARSAGPDSGDDPRRLCRPRQAGGPGRTRGERPRAIRRRQADRQLRELRLVRPDEWWPRVRDHLLPDRPGRPRPPRGPGGGRPRALRDRRTGREGLSDRSRGGAVDACPVPSTNSSSAIRSNPFRAPSRWPGR